MMNEAGNEIEVALETGKDFLAACNSAWACGEPQHRVKKMLSMADKFGAALEKVSVDRSKTAPAPSEVAKAQPDAEMIHQALQFLFWGVGEGFMAAEEAFWDYSKRTGDQDWETLADRYKASIGSEIAVLEQGRVG